MAMGIHSDKPVLLVELNKGTQGHNVTRHEECVFWYFAPLYGDIFPWLEHTDISFNPTMPRNISALTASSCSSIFCLLIIIILIIVSAGSIILLRNQDFVK